MPRKAQGNERDRGRNLKTKLMEMNEESILAWNIIEKTSANLFLTGKAGTGKTTFLKQLKEKSPKRMVVLAPTGIAAINAGGMTIHSFFQLPFRHIFRVQPSEVANRNAISSANSSETSSEASTCWSSMKSVWYAAICSTPSTPCFVSTASVTTFLSAVCSS